MGYSCMAFVYNFSTRDICNIKDNLCQHAVKFSDFKLFVLVYKSNIAWRIVNGAIGFEGRVGHFCVSVESGLTAIESVR
jgi:hypothetical protein